VEKERQDVERRRIEERTAQVVQVVKEDFELQLRHKESQLAKLLQEAKDCRARDDKQENEAVKKLERAQKAAKAARQQVLDEQVKAEAERRRREQAERELISKDEAIEENTQLFFQLASQKRPIEDMAANLDERLVKLMDKADSHMVKQVGSLDVNYMLHVLKLNEEHVEDASHWAQAYRDGPMRDQATEHFRPLGRAFVVDATTEPESYKVAENSEFVQSFRSQYKNKKKADALLNYMKHTWSEFQNSEPPATGFEQRVWSTCTMWHCNKEGKCLNGEPFQKDFWDKPAKVAAMLPTDKLVLLLELKERQAVKDALAKDAN